MVYTPSPPQYQTYISSAPAHSELVPDNLLRLLTLKYPEDCQEASHFMKHLSGPNWIQPSLSAQQGQEAINLSLWLALFFQGSKWWAELAVSNLFYCYFLKYLSQLSVPRFLIVYGLVPIICKAQSSFALTCDLSESSFIPKAPSNTSGLTASRLYPPFWHNLRSVASWVQAVFEAPGNSESK